MGDPQHHQQRYKKPFYTHNYSCWVRNVHDCLQSWQRCKSMEETLRAVQVKDNKSDGYRVRVYVGEADQEIRIDFWPQES